MDENQTYTWLDIAAHDVLIDASFIEADKYDDFMRFLHDDPEDIEPDA